MSVLAIVVNRTGTIEDQQRVERRLQAGGQGPPAGLILMVASPADPGFQVISVWDSMASFARFREGPLAEALEAEGFSPGLLSATTFEAARYQVADHASA
jgi:hypothetical protein